MVETLLVLEPNSQYSRYSEGAILPMSDGRLFFAYTRFEERDHDNAAASIVSRWYSTDGFWSEEMVLLQNEGECNVNSVNLLRLYSGETYLLYGLKNSLKDNKLYARALSDDGQVSDHKRCATPGDGYHVINNDRVVQLKSGRIIIPAALHACTDGTYDTWSPHADAVIYYSDDKGHSWVNGPVLTVDQTVSSGLQEPGVVQLADGRLYLWARTDAGCQYEAFSSDEGITWTAPTPSRLMSPLSPASIKSAPWSGALIAVYNDHSGRHLFVPEMRNPLCLSHSFDLAAQWSPSRVLENNLRGWYCYTSMTFTENHLILSYCAGDPEVGPLNRLKVVKLSRDEL